MEFMGISKISGGNNHFYEMEHIPEEILVNIFSWLKIPDLQNVARTCRMWNIILNKDLRCLSCWNIFHKRLNMMNKDLLHSPISHLDKFSFYNRIQGLPLCLLQEKLPINEHKFTDKIVIQGHKSYEMDSHPNKDSSIFAEIKVLNLVTGEPEESIILPNDPENPINEECGFALYLVGNNLCVARYKEGYTDYKVWDIEKKQPSNFKNIPFLDDGRDEKQIFYGLNCYDFLNGFNVYNLKNNLFEPINKTIFDPAFESISSNLEPVIFRIFNDDYLAFLVNKTEAKHVDKTEAKHSELRVLDLNTDKIEYRIPVSRETRILFHANEGVIYTCSKSEITIYNSISKKPIKYKIILPKDSNILEDMIALDRYLVITTSNNTSEPNVGYIFLFDMEKGGFAGEPVLVPFHIIKMSIFGKLLFCQTNDGINVLNLFPTKEEKEDFEHSNQKNKREALNKHIEEIKDLVSQLIEDEKITEGQSWNFTTNTWDPPVNINLAELIFSFYTEPLSSLPLSKNAITIYKYSLSTDRVHRKIATSLAWIQIHLRNLYNDPFLHKHKIEITPVSYFKALDKMKKFLNNSPISSGNCKALGLHSLLDLEALSINREIISVLSGLSQINELPETQTLVNTLVWIWQRGDLACKDLEDKFFENSNIDKLVKLPMKKLLDEMEKLLNVKLLDRIAKKSNELLLEIRRICSELRQLEILRQAGIADLYLGQMEGKSSWEEIKKEKNPSFSLHEYQSSTNASFVQLLCLADREKPSKRQKTLTE
jgi:hypothetical protein